MDPIVEDYAASLRDLKFNLLPIIENLTTIANENKQAAPGIVAAITERIYKCLPEHKLFALYLLDLVCKNVGPPYSALIGGDLFKIFSNVYVLVGSPARTKMERMYEVWSTAKVKGTSAPLFPREELDKIGNFLLQAGHRPKAGQPLIAEIDAILPRMKLRQASSPDAELAGRIEALEALKSIMQTQALSESDLQGIAQKLAVLRLQELSFEAPAPSAAPAPKSSAAPAVFQQLVESGLVRMEQLLKPNSKPVYEIVLPKTRYEPNVAVAPANPVEEMLIEAHKREELGYDKMRFHELIKVAKALAGSEKLQKFVTGAQLDTSTTQLLYECKPLKCALCGKRFEADERGLQRKRMHLDWHFRINKKQANFKANIQLRNWYLDNVAWVQFDDSNLLEYASSGPARRVEQVKAVRQYVVIALDDINMNNTCTVCLEPVKPTYDDHLGEWIWDECVHALGNKGRRIVHVACLDLKKRPGEDLERQAKAQRV